MNKKKLVYSIILFVLLAFMLVRYTGIGADFGSGETTEMPTDQQEKVREIAREMNVDISNYNLVSGPCLNCNAMVDYNNFILIVPEVDTKYIERTIRHELYHIKYEMGWFVSAIVTILIIIIWSSEKASFTDKFLTSFFALFIDFGLIEIVPHFLALNLKSLVTYSLMIIVGVLAIWLYFKKYGDFKVALLSIINNKPQFIAMQILLIFGFLRIFFEVSDKFYITMVLILVVIFVLDWVYLYPFINEKKCESDT